MIDKPLVRFELKLTICISLLLILALWVYHGSTGNLFVWDSVHYLFKYEDHLSSLSLENLRWMATSLNFHNWHPLTWFSYALDYQLYGEFSMWGYHFSNNILHAINGVLLFVLILTVLGLVYPASQKFVMKRDNNALIAALLAASLFVVHPQHVESVAWVAERKNLICQMFMLLSFLAYVKFVTSAQMVKSRWYLVSLAMFFLAVLSKPMAVTFPAVLLLADVYPLGRTRLFKPGTGLLKQQTYLYLLVEKIPFFLLTLVLVVATLIAQESAVLELPFLQKAINAVHSTLLYLEKFLVPVSLNAHYPYFEVNGLVGALKALLVISIFLAITIVAFYAWRNKKPAWLMAWFFYLGTLVPVLGIIQVGAQGAADRYAYFPTLVIYLLVAVGMYSLLNSGIRVVKPVSLLVAATVVFLFSLQTIQQIGVWKSERSLWSHVIEMDPDNMFAHNNLGIVYTKNADYEYAALLFEAGDENSLRPDSMLALRALTYMHLGRYRESIDSLVKLGINAESNPRLVVDLHCIQYNLGWNFAHLGMYQESKDLFGRIAVDSNSGPDARIWLNELVRVESPDDNLVSIETLPSICEILIPEKI